MIPQDMYELAHAAMQRAYAKYSNFKVGTCLRTVDGLLINGCNVENAAYPLTQCAESSAIGSMICQGSDAIQEIMVLVEGDQLCPPCGGCRQKIYEFATSDTRVHLCTTSGKHKVLTIAELLPFAFDSNNLETA